MRSVFKDKERVKDIISLFGYVMMLGAVAQVMSEPVRQLGLFYIIAFSILLMLLYIFVVVFGIHVIADVVRLSNPDFTTPLDAGHYEKKRTWRDFFQKPLWIFSFLAALLMVLARFMVTVFLG